MTTARPLIHVALCLICVLSIGQALGEPDSQTDKPSEQTKTGWIIGYVRSSWPEITPEVLNKIEASESYKEALGNVEEAYEKSARDLVVTLRSLQTNVKPSSVPIDREGYFRFANLPSGVYEVSAEMPAPPYWTGSNRMESAKAQVTVGPNKTAYLMLCPDLVTITGTITDVSGHPIAGANVVGKQLFLLDRSIPHGPDGDFNHAVREAFAVTDSNGAFELQGFAPSNPFLVASYLMGIVDMRSLETAEITVQADGYVQRAADASKVSLITEAHLTQARRIEEALRQPPVKAIGIKTPAPGEQKALPVCHGYTITNIDIALEPSK